MDVVRNIDSQNIDKLIYTIFMNLQANNNYIKNLKYTKIKTYYI